MTRSLVQNESQADGADRCKLEKRGQPASQAAGPLFVAVGGRPSSPSPILGAVLEVCFDRPHAALRHALNGDAVLSDGAKSAQKGAYSILSLIPGCSPSTGVLRRRSGSASSLRRRPSLADRSRASSNDNSKDMQAPRTPPNPTANKI